MLVVITFFQKYFHFQHFILLSHLHHLIISSNNFKNNKSRVCFHKNNQIILIRKTSW